MKRVLPDAFRTALIVLALSVALVMPLSAHAIVISSISGTVTDADTEGPVAGATTQLWEYVAGPGWTFRATGTTVASGGYAFVGWPAGNYKVLVDKTRYIGGDTGWQTYAGGSLDADVPLWPVAHRVSGRSRFSTAEQVARMREYFDDPMFAWASVDDIVIASGDDRAAADPLAAAGLCWAYPNGPGKAAPLFLVSATRTPDEVKLAVKDIVDQSGPVEVHIVGGPVSVPDARFNDLVAFVGPGKLTKDRVQPTGSRYDMAAAIARRMKQERPGDMTNIPLIANGADSTKFFDALALSAMSAYDGAPILLVSVDSVPPSTQSVINDFAPLRVIIGGGPNTVSASVATQLSDGGAITVDRWWGQNRYGTAADIANNALTEGALGDYSFGLAAKLPDGLTGGSTMGGYFGGPLLLTKSDSIPAETLAVINNWHPKRIYLFGGPNSIAEGVRTQALATIP